MKSLIFVCLLILLSGCTVFRNKDEEATDITYEIINQHVAYYKKRGFSVMGTGAAIPILVNWIDLSYQIDKVCDIPQARKIMVGMTHLLLHLSNTYPEYRKYMCHYPFTAENAVIGLTFLDKKNLYKLPPHLALVLSVRDKLVYYHYDKIREKLIQIHEETFDEGVAHLKE